jgi:pseudaminic acid cytidylyltransferase
MKENRLAIIPARGGSKRIPRKNVKDFLGKPIISYSIEAALSSDLFDEVMVSTDDDEIKDVAIRYGAKVPFLRSPKNSDDFATTLDVIREVVTEYNKLGKSFTIGCCLYPAAPFITSKNLNEAYSLLTLNHYDSVFPVLRYGAPIQRSLKIGPNKRITMCFPESIHSRSQDLEPTFHDAGQFYWMNIPTILEKQRIWTDNSGGIEIREREGQDIDTLDDWTLAELKYTLLQSSKKK